MRLCLLAIGLLACSAQDATKSPPDGSSAPDGPAEADSTDTSIPTEAAASDDASDTSIPMGPCGITLVGPSWASACQTWMDSNCCAAEQYCANNTQCSGWVQCVDNMSGKCGQISILFGPAYNCMTGPPDGSPPLPKGCSWP